MSNAPFFDKWNAELKSEFPIRVIGIDLGTTVSTVTEIVWSPASGEPMNASLIQMEQLTTDGPYVFDLLPSVVALRDGVEFVGTGAHRLRGGTDGLSRNKGIWWDTKNEIGTKRKYPGAPVGYQTPREIASRILRFLNEAALDAHGMPIDRVVVTVPASFQLPQRQDTIDAAQQAGIDLHGGDMLDEPVAAFLDYLMHDASGVLSAKPVNRVMVVDFGGGTCDVALMQVKRTEDGTLDIAKRGVSRFHRIGGSDIDNVIAHEILLPRLMEENGIQQFELNFKNKRDHVLPALAAVAEQLKKKVSEHVAHLRSLGQDIGDDLTVSLPIAARINTNTEDYGTVTLSSPGLSYGEMKSVTDVFFNEAWVQPEHNEYFLATSIFAPIRDCMSRAEWTKDHIDHILLVGGSSLYVGVQDALRAAFPAANILTYKDPLDFQRCVGRGAAYHAAFLAAYGKSPLRSTLAEDLSVETTTGPATIVKGGSELPFPADGGWETVSGLAVPDTGGRDSFPLIVQFKTGNLHVATQRYNLEGVAKGAPIGLRVRIDENQRMEIELAIAGEERPLVIDNPFSVVDNPNADRDRILELEEQVLQAGDVVTKTSLIMDIASLHRKLGEYERARQLLEDLLLSVPANMTVHLLNLLGITCGEMKDKDAQVAFYRQAIERGGHTIASFNLALSLWKDDAYDEAMSILDAAFSQGADCEYHILRGVVLTDQGQEETGRLAMRRGCDELLDDQTLDDLSDFERAWLQVAARRIPDDDLLAVIHEFERERKSTSGGPPDDKWEDNALRPEAIS